MIDVSLVLVIMIYLLRCYIYSLTHAFWMMTNSAWNTKEIWRYIILNKRYMFIHIKIYHSDLSPYVFNCTVERLWYNWNTFESGVKHHNPVKPPVPLINAVLKCVFIHINLWNENILVLCLLLDSQRHVEDLTKFYCTCI